MWRSQVHGSLQLADISAQLSSNTKFFGAIPAANGKIIFVPYDADSVGVFDPAAERLQLVDIPARLSSTMKSAATVEAAVDQFLNAIGNVAVIMFVTLMLTVLVPFRCLSIPTGTKVMAPNPCQLCWHGAHNIMAA